MSSIVLPNDVQAEVGLIGSIILHPEFAAQISWFKADYLYHNENKCLYWAITELLKENVENVDDFNIIKKINENPGVKGLFDELKIPSLQVLIDDYKIVARHTLEEYKMLVNRVTNLAYRRRAYDVSTKFSDLCLKDTQDNINDLNLQFHNSMNKLAEKFIVQKDISLIGDVIYNIWQEIQDQRQMGLIGIPSKYPIINDYFTYRNGGLVVVGGRAKAGKSSFFLNEVHHKLKLGMSVCIMDTEMPDRDLLPRMIAIESGLTQKEIERGTYLGNNLKEQKVENALAWWAKQKFIHVYDTSWTFDKIYTTAKLLKLRKDFDLNFLVFDYIKMTSSADNNNGEKMNYFLGRFTDFLKNNVAGELDIPVLAGAQMSPYDVRLADSDSINRYASTVGYWMLKTKDDYSKEQGMANTGNHKFVIDYNRFGKSHNKEEKGGINFIFDKSHCLIEQAKYQPADDQSDEFEETEFNIYAESN